MKHLSSNTYHASPLICHLSFIISHVASIIYHRAPISQHPSSLFICNKGPTKTPRVVCKLSRARSFFGSGPGGITPTHWYHTNCSGIGMPENPDIWRVTLCNHGLDCRQRRMGVCMYAHSLAELLPPLESRILYPGVWSDGCDRFFGQ